MAGSREISLVLRMGGLKPQPVPPLVMQALRSTEVFCDAEQGGAFRLTFRVNTARWAEYGALTESVSEPLLRVYVSVLLDRQPSPLIEGVVTQHRIDPDENGAAATVLLTGEDLGMLLDQKERNEPHPEPSDEEIASKVLDQYVQQGLSSEVKRGKKRAGEQTEWQTETDLAFLQRLAKRNNYLFTIEPRELGRSVAYFGPRRRDEEPLPPLRCAPGSARNVRTLKLTGETVPPMRVIGATLDPKSQSNVQVESERGGSDAAGRVRILREAAHQDVAGAERAAAAAGGTEPGGAEGSLSTLDYMTVLRLHRRLEVTGLPLQRDGMFVVRSVTHSLKDGSYVQSFRLARDAERGR